MKECNLLKWCSITDPSGKTFGTFWSVNPQTISTNCSISYSLYCRVYCLYYSVYSGVSACFEIIFYWILYSILQEQLCLLCFSLFFCISQGHDTASLVNVDLNWHEIPIQVWPKYYSSQASSCDNDKSPCRIVLLSNILYKTGWMF